MQSTAQSSNTSPILPQALPTPPPPRIHGRRHSHRLPSYRVKTTVKHRRFLRPVHRIMVATLPMEMKEHYQMKGQTGVQRDPVRAQRRRKEGEACTRRRGRIGIMRRMGCGVSSMRVGIRGGWMLLLVLSGSLCNSCDGRGGTHFVARGLEERDG